MQLVTSFRMLPDGGDRPKSWAQRFGCRMMAFISGDPASSESDTFRKQLLIHAHDSLKAQSTKGHFDRDGSKRPLMLEDLSGMMYRLGGNPHGWGLAAFYGDMLERIRKGTSAFLDKAYPETIERLQENHPNVLMAHVRAWDDPKTIMQEKNAHPFTHNGWAMMHNGYISAITSDTFKQQIAAYPKELQPKGDTDTEAAFCFIMKQLQNQFGTTDPARLTTQQVTEGLTSAVKELIKLSPPVIKTINETAFPGLSATMQGAPSINLILSDGKRLWAFRRGPGLFLGVRKDDNNKLEYVISSEVVTTDPAKHKVQWLLLPDNNFLTVELGAEKKIRSALYPLDI